MHVLLIEDDELSAETIAEELHAQGITVSIARSRDSALEELNGAAFDVIVCDLELPTTDGALDKAIEHGDLVRVEVRKRLPGTPVIVHSAHASDAYLEQLLAEAESADVFGTRNAVSLLRARSKQNLTELLRELVLVRDELQALRDIELQCAQGLALTPHEARCIAIFARRLGGTLCNVASISQGLSGALVLRVIVWDSRGNRCANVVCKLDVARSVRDERERHQQHVGPLLQINGFPGVADVVVAGAGSRGALFYSVAENYNDSLFRIVETRPEHAADLVGEIRALTDVWSTDAPQRNATLREVRQSIIADERLRNVTDEVEAIRASMEPRPVQVFECVQHCDLHGANVLCNPDGHIVLIDFGDVGPAISTYDPITLEMSLLFHPSGRAAARGWPTVEQAEQWADLQAYTAGSPATAFVAACREWSTSRGPGQRAVLGAAYSHALRALRYADNDPEICAAIMRSVSRAWD